MKIYCYNDWITNELGEQLDFVVERNEDQIIKEYWSYWFELMEEKYGKGHELITEENCIKDWVTINCGWEKKV
jgi:hypothetical protein